MAQLDLDHLEELIKLLRAYGVPEFSCPEFSIRMPGVATLVPGTVDDSPAPPAPLNWRHPSLWSAQGGSPIGFDGSPIKR